MLQVKLVLALKGKKSLNPADTHPAIPPRVMWLWPGMAPSLAGTKKKHKKSDTHQDYNTYSTTVYCLKVGSPLQFPRCVPCHGLSPSIFRLESQSRPPSLQDKQNQSYKFPSFRKTAST